MLLQLKLYDPIKDTNKLGPLHMVAVLNSAYEVFVCEWATTP